MGFRPARPKPALPLLSCRQMNLGQFTEPKLLIPRLLSDRQEGAIRELTKRLEASGRIRNAPGFVEAVLKPETELPTFIEGVALPHARGAAVQRLSLAVGLSTVGIPWAGNKGRGTAHAIFLFAVPLTEGQVYLRVLSGLFGLIQDEPTLAALMRTIRQEEMFNIMKTVRMVRSDCPAPASGALV